MKPIVAAALDATRSLPGAWAGADVISMTGGRTWPEPIRARTPRPLSVPVIVAARRPE